MAPERYFLGWDAPVTTKVQQFLLPLELSGPVDLENKLIVVPTRQAGRRLREALAMHCAEEGTALLSPQVVTPTFFLHRGHESTKVANETEVTAVWIDVLMRADLTQCPHFFPARTVEQSFTWAMYTGGLLQRLRDTLADGGLRITDVDDRFSNILEERERWKDMSRLEAAYLAQLDELGLKDPCDMMIREAEEPELPEGIERIVIAAVPDPTPLMIRAVAHLASRVAVDILIHAPESMSDWFDDWGRPITDKWNETNIVIPEADRNVLLAGSLTSQSRKVVEIMAEESHRCGPADIAIGVPNSEITPSLMADLADKNLVAFDPAGRSMTEHPLFRLLESFHGLASEGTYASFSAFLRHADVLAFLRQKHNLSTRWLLQELDEFQNQHLPLGMEDITRHLVPKGRRRQEGHLEFPNLRNAIAFIQEQLDSFQHQDMDSAVRSLLQTLYEVRMVNPNNPEDEEFIAASGLIDEALRELAGEEIGRASCRERV